MAIKTRMLLLFVGCLAATELTWGANQNGNGTDGNQGSGVSGSTGNQGNDKLVGNAGGGHSGGGSTPPVAPTDLPSATPEPLTLTLVGMTATGIAGFLLGRRCGKRS
jgi:hypothetical protein